MLEQSLDLQTRGLERLESGALDFYAHRRAHATLEHDGTRGDRLQLWRRRHAGELGNARNRSPDVVGIANLVAPYAKGPAGSVGNQIARRSPGEVIAIVFEAQRPALFVAEIFGAVVHHDLEHRDRRRVEGTFGAAEFAHDRLHLGNRRD